MKRNLTLYKAQTTLNISEVDTMIFWQKRTKKKKKEIDL